jgi:hypothetical protein
VGARAEAKSVHMRMDASRESSNGMRMAAAGGVGSRLAVGRKGPKPVALWRAHLETQYKRFAVTTYKPLT